MFLLLFLALMFLALVWAGLFGIFCVVFSALGLKRRKYVPAPASAYRWRDGAWREPVGYNGWVTR